MSPTEDSPNESPFPAATAPHGTDGSSLGTGRGAGVSGNAEGVCRRRAQQEARAGRGFDSFFKDRQTISASGREQIAPAAINMPRRPKIFYKPTCGDNVSVIRIFFYIFSCKFLGFYWIAPKLKLFKTNPKSCGTGIKNANCAFFRLLRHNARHRARHRKASRLPQISHCVKTKKSSESFAAKATAFSAVSFPLPVKFRPTRLRACAASPVMSRLRLKTSFKLISSPFAARKLSVSSGRERSRCAGRHIGKFHIR